MLMLMLKHEMKLLKICQIALDCTKIDVSSSKPKALSWGHAHRNEAQLSQEAQTLLALANSSKGQAVPDGMVITTQITQREDRLNAPAQAKIKPRLCVPPKRAAGI